MDEADVRENGFILDGFPRTVAQAAALDEVMAEKGRSLDRIIEMKVDEQALFDRIDRRAREAAAAGQEIRADDNADTLKHRILVYKEQTAPILPYYEAAGRLKQVDGMASIDEVTKQLEALIGDA